MRNIKNSLEKHCYKCNVILTDSNWHPGNKNLKYPKFICKRCNNISTLICKRHSRGVDKNFMSEDYNKLFEQQQGKCAICGKHQTLLKAILNADHDHKTGEVRGLLCIKCNVKMGWYDTYKKSILTYLRM